MKRLLELKMLVFLGLGLLACQGFAQTAFFNSVKLEATIVVSQPSLGADLVEMTFLGADYTPEAIDEKLAILGKELGDQPRGVQTSNEGGQFIKVKFAINNLIRKEKSPKFDLAALAKAMAFGIRPTKSFSVFFSKVMPDNTTPARFFAPNDAWKLEGIVMRSPAGCEYRIQVNTKNPNDIYMPGNEPVKPEPKKEDSGGSSKLLILGGIIVGAIAVGLLVYSALLRPRPGAR